MASNPQSPVASVPHGEGIKVERTLTINRTPEELYNFFRNFANLPRFLKHIKSVTCMDNVRSHWVVSAPAGTIVEWDAIIHNEIAGELISWRSLEGADVNNAGTVTFRPASSGRGTEMRVVMSYEPPAGKVGQFIAKLFGEEPLQQLKSDLRDFKALVETGEIPTIEGQSSGRWEASQTERRAS